MAPRPQKVKVILLCIVLVFGTFLLLLRKPKLSRSASWEPMASLILNSGRTKSDPHLIQTVNGIPKIIHQTWRTIDVPILFKPWITSWLNKNDDWEYWFWTDADIKSFITTKYPDYLQLYESYPATGYRVDVFRYFVLYEYGGVYSDLDMESINPITPYLERISQDCFLSQEPLAHALFLSPTGIPLVSNALMGCAPEHPFLSDVVRNLPSRTGIFTWTDVLGATGPQMLTAAYRVYASKMPLSTEKHGTVHVAKPDDFHPTLDDSMVDAIRRKCMSTEVHWFHYIFSRTNADLESTICVQVVGYQFNGKPKGDSVTNHHWTHTWGGKRYDPWGILNGVPTTFSMRDLLVKYKKRN